VTEPGPPNARRTSTRRADQVDRIDRRLVPEGLRFAPKDPPPPFLIANAALTMAADDTQYTDWDPPDPASGWKKADNGGLYIDGANHLVAISVSMNGTASAVGGAEFTAIRAYDDPTNQVAGCLTIPLLSSASPISGGFILRNISASNPFRIQVQTDGNASADVQLQAFISSQYDLRKFTTGFPT